MSFSSSRRRASVRCPFLGEPPRMERSRRRLALDIAPRAAPHNARKYRMAPCTAPPLFEVLFTADRLVPQNTLKEGMPRPPLSAYWRTTIVVSTRIAHAGSHTTPNLSNLSKIWRCNMADETSYGWAGKILRVNLSTGSITTQPTDPYKEYIGGMGLANKIMYDEVPAGTDPLLPPRTSSSSP